MICRDVLVCVHVPDGNKEAPYWFGVERVSIGRSQSCCESNTLECCS